MTIEKINSPAIEVDVAYYDTAEAQKFKSYPQDLQKGLAELTSGPVSISTSTFLYFFLFHRMARGMPGYESTEAVRRDLSRAVNAIDTALIHNGVSLALPSPQTRPPNDVAEHLGEAVGLAVASKLHGLTEADWQRLEVKGFGKNKKLTPSFDYQLAAEENRFVQVETKGSVVDRNQLKASVVSLHKANITKKKVKLSTLPSDAEDPYPADVRYGTITTVDGRIDSRLRCWLVDPPAEGLPIEPRAYKLLSRMTFLARWLGLVSPRSQLTSALASRLNALLALNDPLDLDSVPLVRGSGEEFKFFLSSANSDHYTFFGGRSRLLGFPGGGLAIVLSEKSIAFIGINQNLLPLAADQRFDEILEYGATSTTERWPIELVLRHDEASRLGVDSVPWEEMDRGHVKLRTEGNFHFIRSGLVFGILDPRV
ncbi:hypothetical protein M2282_000671 [Variovorax boronicumulans]|uniref:hypothetical protein n=1 Tax=Variovorax boronicumulans TaxID=436515 RepID=UPI002476A0A3|nr:hypothetical protein [Variovorax boronicumulans]MDH6165543.1 hypothetical protein [Variovorax boronicumulans]